MEVNKGDMFERLPWFFRGSPDNLYTMVVAEIGNNHEGSLGNAIHMIECAALAGADAVKIQYHLANFESSPNEKFPKRFIYHPQDETRREYWSRMGLFSSGILEIMKVCNRCLVKLIISVFCVEAVQKLHKLYLNDIWALKIPSGEMNNRDLVQAVHNTGKRTILSTGMSDTREINSNIVALSAEPRVEEIYVLQCTTQYPTQPADIGMNVVEGFSRNLLFQGGLSDHSGTIYPSIVAAYLGAAMVEVHVTFHKRMFGADISSSITFEELEQLVRGVRFANAMRMNPINKDLYTPPEDAKVYHEGRQR